MENKQYPDHIYDKTRRDIAVMMVKKEFIKLFPSASTEERENQTKDIYAWFEGEKSHLAPVHDFWNGIDGILSGFKLKQLVKYITAENIKWAREDVAFSDFDLAWNVPSLQGAGEPPYSLGRIQEFLKSNPDEYRRQLEINERVRGDFVSRDDYPIILLRQRGKLVLLDGNRRALQGILRGKTNINAWVGEMGPSDLPMNYWVGTAFLRELLRNAEYADSNGNTRLVEATSDMLEELFEVSEIARINWQLRCANQGEMAQRLVRIS